MHHNQLFGWLVNLVYTHHSFCGELNNSGQFNISLNVTADSCKVARSWFDCSVSLLSPRRSLRGGSTYINSLILSFSRRDNDGSL